eukprot:2510564-Prymnesium_polylepis.1
MARLRAQLPQPQPPNWSHATRLQTATAGRRLANPSDGLGGLQLPLERGELLEHLPLVVPQRLADGAQLLGHVV